jgi:hypothetical protein
VLGKRLARGRQRRAAAQAVEEGDAELVLQVLDVLGDRWLGEEERAPGGGERAALGNGLEHAQPLQIH